MTRKLFLLTLFLAVGSPLGAQTTAAAPTLSPPGGTYSATQNVCMTTTTTGANIWYTTDGSDPTLASTRITSTSGCTTVATTQTLKALAAIPVVDRQNVQNLAPGSGTPWKTPLCVTATAWSSTTAYAVGAFASSGSVNYVAIAAGTNHPPASSPTFWTNTGCNTDDPGGTGVAQNVTQTINNASPSLSGKSMKFAGTGQTSKQTNWLYTVNNGFGASNLATNFYADFQLQLGANSSQISSVETDTAFLFETTSANFRYMYGTQYCFTGASCPGGVSGFDLVGNSNVPWTYSGVSSPAPAAGSWLHYQFLTGRVPAEETSKPCTDGSGAHWPYLYWYHIILNGVDNHTGNNGANGWRYCANSNPGFGLVTGFQFQIDQASHASQLNVSYFIDNANFLATQPLSTISAATYTITNAPPVTLKGQTNFSGSLITIQ